MPADVWHASHAGARFLEERYPECRAHAAEELRIDERDGGRTVIGVLRSADGPVREAAMRFTAPEGIPEQVPYGGDGKPVWGSRFTCAGVDLDLAAHVQGRVVRPDGSVERLDGAPGVVTLGSYGRITPRRTLTL
ncbi:MAG: hypothetical protein LC624_04085 [Halobacteriales archaeon]|nr:hypothetical protein [Halobacteriales archaeon]